MTTVTIDEIKRLLNHAVSDVDAHVEVTLFRVKFKLYPARIGVDVPMRRRRVNRRWVEEEPRQEDVTRERMKLFTKFLLRLTREVGDGIAGEVKLRHSGGIDLQLGVTGEATAYDFDAIWVPCEVAGFDQFASQITIGLPGAEPVSVREAFRRIVL